MHSGRSGFGGACGHATAPQSTILYNRSMAFAPSKMQLTTPAFEQLGAIPKRYTGEGDDVSPPLEWRDAPEETKSFAIFCHDPDAPKIEDGSYGFVHWVLYNLPSSTTSVAEGAREGTQGRNDFGGTGYGGPMPPSGHGVHHYFFWLLALDTKAEFEPGLDLTGFLRRAEPHLLGMNRLVGTYQIG